jgi:hypothetical protein
LDQTIEIRNDHRQRPQRERHKENATCTSSQSLHAALSSWQVDFGVLLRHGAWRMDDRAFSFRNLALLKR